MRTSRLSRLVAVSGLSLASLALAPGAAFAQEASDADISQARDLGGQAQKAMDDANYPESERLWTAANRLYSKAPTLTLGLARAAAKNNHFVLAKESYNKIIREWGNVASPPPAFKDALEAARAEVGAVAAKVASVTVIIDGGAQSPQISIDGAVIPAAALGLPRPVDPGQHAVHGEAVGYKAADATFTVAEAGRTEAHLKFEKAPEGAAPPGGATAHPGGGEPPKGDAAAGTNGKGGSNKTLAIVALGVGGAGLAVGAVTGFIAIGKHGDLKDKCPNGTCPASVQSDVDSYKTMGTISTVGFIVGGVGVAAGAVLWFTSPKETAASAAGPKWATFEPTKGVKMTPYVGGTSAGVTGRF